MTDIETVVVLLNLSSVVANTIAFLRWRGFRHHIERSPLVEETLDKLRAADREVHETGIAVRLDPNEPDLGPSLEDRRAHAVALEKQRLLLWRLRGLVSWDYGRRAL